MGVDGLSMSLGNLLKVKWVIRTISLEHARELLAQSLTLTDSGPIRKMLNQVLEEKGLGGLVRAGK
jgi:phosphotransferase system enzyme I (PtsP)